MIRLFKHYVPHAVLLLGLLDFMLLMAAAEGGWILRARQIGMEVDHVSTRIAPLLSFGLAIQTAMIAVGVYGPEALQSIRYALARLLVAISLGVLFLSVMHFLLPDITLWRSNSLYAMGLAIALLLAIRVLLGSMLGGEAFKRRLVVLGAGNRADRIREIEQRKGSGFLVVGYIAMNDGAQVIPEAINRSAIYNLADFVVRLAASEVVLALEERRNALPLSDLLRIKTTGVHVNEISTFLERETGRVDLDSVNPSWLIFSDGFSAGRRLSSIAKRLFDVLASSILLLLTGPIILLAALLVKLDSKGPAFYRQQRVGLYGEEFWIVKLRTMRQDAELSGQAVWAEKDDPRITRLGYWLRKLRIDELPQTWTVLKGEMSFVGPRPERRQFVEDLEQHLRYYAERHMVKPGITGWAQINYPYGASIEDARNKLEYDLYYAKNYTPFLDLLILIQTLRVILWPEGAR
ncbi:MULTISPECIES: TIGR03013 family XrtA/PEP-CTERM system glycosyltransferase [Sphingobium]|uniref:Sugar transferase n=2 Tax=Sphingobium fuliginis (strain ATCC 27551) TaxID=336203 RepID=A0ABQ1FBA1_SPHSA|nr:MULTISPECIES: TIGR03013 family XrtA/PEP-CTERM system glycosyltransferase [Sphingobium]OAP32865.1 sugar transferase [Sphingobium sp. 20006FA]AJR25760.1 sugar transferase [Sphingobium sp. YBL2]KXU32481.1 sugar transferase [Sphingobium sp. AM]KYC32538.1 sugar transferase [Sphingobium sp. 22B]MCB4860751.1 TIGR03013 family PEP-CTERM/XrtA system glycosyltransferase [Sphingobium sp. PNB]